jgi:hypothetical protein
VTGGRPGRDPRIAGRRERGPQRGEAPPGETRWTGTGGAELEELDATAVTSRAGAGIGIRTAIAGVAVIGLLAVGFGAFGGRQPASALPTGSPVAAASESAPPTPRLAEPEGPLVTPFEPCAAERNIIPTVHLEVSDRAYAGAIEVLDANPDALPSDTPTSGEPQSVPVAIGDEAAIVIDGARCALAWVIDLDAATTIDVVGYGATDSARPAAQNRFEVPLSNNPGRDSLLRAELVFPGFSIRATWNVQVARPEHPKAVLQWLDGDVQTAVESCFVAFQYETGWQETTGDCRGAEPPPRDAKSVHERALFRFSMGDWPFSLGGISCGQGMDDAYVPDDIGCAWTRNEANGVITVDLPPSLAKGAWTLAIDACAFNGPIYGASLCGTWYAGIKVR